MTVDELVPAEREMDRSEILEKVWVFIKEKLEDRDNQKGWSQDREDLFEIFAASYGRVRIHGDNICDYVKAVHKSGRDIPLQDEALIQQIATAWNEWLYAWEMRDRTRA